METDDPNQDPRPPGGGGRRRKPQTEDWLLVPPPGGAADRADAAPPGGGAEQAEDAAQPETVEQDLPRSEEYTLAAEERLESLELAVSELRDRHRPAEATARAAITRAAAAEAKAADGLHQQELIRVELASIHDEIAKREEIARQEGSALRDVVAKLAESYATPPAGAASAEPKPAAPRRAGNGDSGFPQAASEVEQKLTAIEGRVEEADATVRSLLRTRRDRPRREGEPESSRIDVNRIGFEQLRELGLSVTQAARVLARRDARGEYSSLDQLDDLLDIPRELIDRLKRSLRL